LIFVLPLFLYLKLIIHLIITNKPLIAYSDPSVRVRASLPSLGGQGMTTILPKHYNDSHVTKN